MAHDIPVRQCVECGALCTRIFTKNAVVLADVKPALIHESRGGSDVGYTRSGRRIEGYWLQKGDKQEGFEAHPLHRCKRKQEQAGGQ